MICVLVEVGQCAVCRSLRNCKPALRPSSDPGRLCLWPSYSCPVIRSQCLSQPKIDTPG